MNFAQTPPGELPVQAAQFLEIGGPEAVGFLTPLVSLDVLHCHNIQPGIALRLSLCHSCVGLERAEDSGLRAQVEKSGAENASTPLHLGVAGLFAVLLATGAPRRSRCVFSKCFTKMTCVKICRGGTFFRKNTPRILP